MDFGQGAWVLREGKRKRLHLFRVARCWAGNLWRFMDGSGWIEFLEKAYPIHCPNPTIASGLCARRLGMCKDCRVVPRS